MITFSSGKTSTTAYQRPARSRGLPARDAQSFQLTRYGRTWLALAESQQGRP